MKEVKDIWQFFENMNEYVYATDIETHEIVYMNRKTLQAYGLQSLEDAKGKKCYEILQKTLIPCGMCNNDRLSVGEFEEWHYYNPIIDRYLMLKDTLIEDSSNGKKYRVELGVDISEKRTQDGVIQKYQNMEFMINEGLRVALQTATPELLRPFPDPMRKSVHQKAILPVPLQVPWRSPLSVSYHRITGVVLLLHKEPFLLFPDISYRSRWNIPCFFFSPCGHQPCSCQKPSYC